MDGVGPEAFWEEEEVCRGEWERKVLCGRREGEARIRRALERAAVRTHS